MKPRVEVNFNCTQQRAFVSGKPIYTPSRNEFLFNHARSGLMLALQALKLPVGSKVGMMVYNCHTVMNAIVQPGCEVVFIDVDDGLKIDMDDLKKKSNGLAALIVTHLFGIENDVDAIRSQYPNLIIIEDCAHAFGKEIEGDFGVYSIGQGKMPSLGDGGILVVKNEKYLGIIESIYNQTHEYSSIQESRLFLKLLITSILFNKTLYGWLTLPLKRSRESTSGKETILIKRMASGIRAMYATMKDSVNIQIQNRRNNAQNEMNNLQRNPIVKNVFYGENAFMLVAHCADIAPLKNAYAKAGFETATHFASCIKWARKFGYKGDCPNAERLVNELLMIPVYQN